MKAVKLTAMQKRYIWLAGSFPELVVRQGRGYRSPQTLYAIDRDTEELVIFGSSNPLNFMEGRLFQRTQAPGTYTLTDAGEDAFRRLVATGQGLELNRQIRKVTLRPRAGDPK